jgi:hypothetical protein
MNRKICEREEQTSAAVLRGAIDPEIAPHAQRCTACSDILLVGEFLRNEGSLADGEQNAVPDPGLIWRKAQQRAAQRAVRLALRPIRIMTALACLAFVCSPWLRLLLPLAQSVASSFSGTLDSNLMFFSKAWPTTPNQSVLLLAVFGTIVLLGMGSWLMLREE